MSNKRRSKLLRFSSLSQAGKAVFIICVILLIAVAISERSKIPGKDAIMTTLGLTPSSDTMAILSAAASLLFLAALFVFLSLRSRRKGEENDRSEVTYEPKTIHSSVSRLEELAARMSEKVTAFNPMSDNAFKDSLLNEFRSAISGDVIRSIRERYGVDRIEQIFAEAKVRKLETIDIHHSRANAILLTGSVICGMGIIALMYIIVGNRTDLMWHSQLLYYVPRLSIVVVIELLAFFFLSLYKRVLDDLKYVENEITNSESREAAIHAALAGENESQISGIVTALIALDRNDTRVLDPKVRPKVQDSVNQRVTIEAISQIANLAKGLS